MPDSFFTDNAQAIASDVDRIMTGAKDVVSHVEALPHVTTHPESRSWAERTAQRIRADWDHLVRSVQAADDVGFDVAMHSFLGAVRLLAEAPLIIRGVVKEIMSKLDALASDFHLSMPPTTANLGFGFSSPGMASGLAIYREQMAPALG